MIQLPTGEQKVEAEAPGISRRNLTAGLGIGLSVALAALTTPKSAKAAACRPSLCGGGNNCFVRGTRILTPDGETPIEQLRPGDLVTTASGTAKPIKWIGHRSIAVQDLREMTENLPVRVQRFALSDAAPQRDLFLSAGHSIHIDGVLVPIGHLINGRTIARCPAPDVGALEYYHIELNDHDVLFAEGAPCETLLVRSDAKVMFDNRRQSTDLSPTSGIEQIGLSGRKSEIKSRFRSALSPIFDRRTRFDKIRDRLEERALNLSRAA